VLEADGDVGGNWRHGVYDSTHIISSRDSTAYAEFPMPRDYPDFPSRAQMLTYLTSYAEAFDLNRHIRFGTTVTRVSPLSPDGLAGWEVTTTEPDGSSRTRRYDGVVVANGHHWSPRQPSYDGSFAGKELFAKDYRNLADVGERVLVVGGGNSACDIAVEVGNDPTRTALMSVRRGYWLLPKTLLGKPVSELDRGRLPLWAQRAMLRVALAIVVGPHERYGLPKPDHKPFERHPVVNSQLPYALRHGRVVAKPDIARLDGGTVHFTDGTCAAVDTIVWATGYDVAFPFLEPDPFVWRDGLPLRQLGMLAPDVAGLYVFGVLQPRGGAGPIISRLAELLAAIVRAQAARPDVPIATLVGRREIPDAKHLVGVSEALRRIERWDRTLARAGKAKA
jgi:cation diffusion facilitator CzcD-associated flavoprotein CzcO